MPTLNSAPRLVQDMPNPPPIEIGLLQVYDKLCTLDDKIAAWHLEAAVEFAQLKLRVKSLEDEQVSRRALYGAYFSSAVTLLMGVVAIVVKVG